MGKARRPAILFIHEWSQHHLCWAKQYESALADEFRLIAFDLRGHGMSDAPLEPEHYTDGKLWADDLAAIIEKLRLDRTVLVAWSYGAFVICDYVRAHGEDRVAAINFVEGVVKLRPAAFGTLIGPGSSTTSRARPPTICRRTSPPCVRASVPGHALPAADIETALSWNIVGPARVRANLAAREIDDDVLRTLTVPVLVTHGRADSIALPAMAEHIVATCPTAEASWYDSIGHAPHLEDAERFNRELAALSTRMLA